MKRILIIISILILAGVVQAQQGPKNYYEIPSRQSVFTTGLGAGTLILQADSVRWLKLTQLVKPGWKLDTVYKQGWYKLATGAAAMWYNVKDYGAKGDGVTDDYNAINTLLGKLQHTGGTIYFPSGTYKITGKLRIMRHSTYGTTPVQLSVRLTGEGGGIPAGSDGTTILDLSYNGTDAKIFTNGRGLLEIDHLTIRDAIGGSLPILATTNTTLHLHDMMFMGARYSGCSHGVVLGGTNPTPVVVDSTINSAFQGYGTVIENCQFAHLKTAIKLQTAASGVVIKNNNFIGGCDTSDPYIDINCPTGGNNENIHGGTISDNMFTMIDRKYGVKFFNGYHFTLSGNTFYDIDAQTVASLYFTPRSGLNRIVESLTIGAIIDSSPAYNSNTYIGDTTKLRHILFHGNATTSTGSYIASGNGNGMALNTAKTLGMYRYYDNIALLAPSGGKVGINVTNPATALDVNGRITSSSISVGGTLGDSTMAVTGGTHLNGGLHVDEHLIVGSESANPKIQIGHMANDQEEKLSFVDGDTEFSYISQKTDDNRFIIYSAFPVYFNNESNIIISTGNLGIGTTAPSESIETSENIKIKKSVKQTAIPATDHTASGDLITLTAGVAMGIGDVVYIEAVTGKAVLCKADAIANCPYALAICTDVSVSINSSGNFMIKGALRDDTWNWTIGGLIYISTTGITGNTLTQTAPSTSNHVIMPVGVALSADVIYFYGNMNSVEKQ